MSNEAIIAYIVFGLFGLAGWFMKRTIDKLELKQEEHSKAIHGIKEEYLHKSDFKEFKVELRSMFEEIKQDIRDLKQK